MVRRVLVALVAVLVLSTGACADNGSSSSGSSNGSSSNGSSGSSGGSSGSSDGSSNFDASSNNGSSGSSNGSSNGGSTNGGSSDDDNSTETTVAGGSTGATVPPSPPSGYTLPQPDADGQVTVPDEPPKEIRDESPRTRLATLPPVPRGCLDDDLTLLDAFAPFVSVPLRLTYCLLYVGTIARLPSEINIRVAAPSFEGPTINVPLLTPDRSQRPLATVALLLLVVATSITVGYALGRRRRAPA